MCFDSCIVFCFGFGEVELGLIYGGFELGDDLFFVDEVVMVGEYFF